MDTIYQSLVTVNPVTLIAQICNLFIQLLIVKIFFLDKIKAILDQRREAADKQIAEAEAAKSEANAIKETYEQNMRVAKAKADDLLLSAQKTATLRSEEIISQAQAAAAQLKSKASADIEMEKKKAINDAKDEISGLAMAIAGKVVERELTVADQAQLIDRFLDELGDNV
ncbi:MAG: F0F1 ATP synthase subunit B [Faecousia sp.]